MSNSYSAPPSSQSYSAPSTSSSSGYSSPSSSSSGFTSSVSSAGYSSPSSSSSFSSPSASISSYDAPVISNYEATEIITENFDGAATYDVNAADIATSYTAGNPFLRTKKAADANARVAEDTFQPSEEWPGIVRNARETELLDQATVLTDGEQTYFSGIVAADNEASGRQGRQAVAEDASGSLATVAESGDGSAAFVSGFVPSDAGNPYFAAQRRRGLPPSRRRTRKNKSFFQKMKDFFTRRN